MYTMMLCFMLLVAFPFLLPQTTLNWIQRMRNHLDELKEKRIAAFRQEEHESFNRMRQNVQRADISLTEKQRLLDLVNKCEQGEA